MDTFRIIAEAHSITYWVDYGSLLGLAREGDMLAVDFDGDVSIPRADLTELMKLKDEIKAMYGLNLVGKGDFVFAKWFSLLYFGKWDGYMDGMFPGGRLYDADMHFYIDIYSPDHITHAEADWLLLYGGYQPLQGILPL